MLGKTSIADQFDATFFQTDFWFMWCTTFAFQPWHSAVEFKRYLVRFAHMVAGLQPPARHHAHGLQPVRFMVRPLHKWLAAARRTIRVEYPRH